MMATARGIAPTMPQDHTSNLREQQNQEFNNRDQQTHHILKQGTRMGGALEAQELYIHQWT